MRVIDLVKTYKTKSGSVQALKGVSFDLPDNGMVFILGRSGCGKSTLLNVLSGLDNFDDGDVIVDGKSLKDLSFSELDDYRNSICGFVFQEYNLIPELDVFDNIALALELRGEKEVAKKVSEALEKVGLGGYEKRKISTLSGGQKQRIAIARSIIKDPRIIFADEPSGALDSDTGASIFELLKELSKDRLVLVVSHDRESANKYGDRIIELSDGKVIGDTFGDFSHDDNKRSSTYKRPKMPLWTAVKIGCSNFKFHPIRLLATIFLSMIAFSFLGIALNPVVDSLDSIAYSTMDKNDLRQSILIKYDTSGDGAIINFTDDDITRFKDIVGNALPAVNLSNIDNMASVPHIQYYSRPIFKSRISESLLKDFDFSLSGELPNENEVAITKYTAEVLEASGLLIDDKLEKYSDTQFIGKPLVIDGKSYTISGIVDTHFDSRKYESLKNPNTDMDLYNRFIEELSYSAHNVLFLGGEISIPDFSLRISSDDISDNDTELTQIEPLDTTFKTSTLITGCDGVYIPAYFLLTNTPYFDQTERFQSEIFDDYLDSHMSELLEIAGQHQFDQDGYSLKKWLYSQKTGEFHGISIDNLILDALNENPDCFSDKTPLTFYVTNDLNGNFTPVKIKGVFLNTKPDSILADSSVYDEISALDTGNYDYLIVSQKHISRANFERLLSNTENYQLRNYVVDSVYNLKGKIGTLKNVMTYLAIAFAVFSALLLLNFMMCSVTEKTNTIGILKSLGSSNFNLIKIFILEGLILGALIFAATLIGHALFGWLFSLYFSGICGSIFIAVFGVTPLVSLILLSVIAVFAIMGCLLPIIRLSRLKPMEYLNKSF